jgi:hypothetical protein
MRNTNKMKNRNLAIKQMTKNLCKIVLSAVLLNACTKPTATPPATTSCAQVEVTPNGLDAKISTPTTWKANTVYIIREDLQIESALTIEPGAIIKISNASIELSSNGKVIANGTLDKHIVFTSLADDSYCGDNNNDGTATKPEKGDWDFIRIFAGTNHQFRYCDFLYAGGSYYACIRVDVANPFVFDHCTFAHILSGAAPNAYVISAWDRMTDAATQVFTNNAIYDCDRPMKISHGYTLDPSNIFHNPNNINEKNKRNGIYVYGYGFTNSTVSWNVTEVPYIIEEYLQYSSTKSLMIGNDVVVKFIRAADGISYTGNNLVLANSAILTSYKDDTVGGDANGDGNSSGPLAADWLGVYRSTLSNYIASPNIRYAKN